MRMALRISSASALVSATRSWLRRDSVRTLRPNRINGSMITGTSTTISPVSFGLVMASMISPPTSRSMLRRATEALEPTTDCRMVVSVVRRDRTSPVRVVS